MRLFHYDHCPYCVKARMIFGLKHVPFTLQALDNDDEARPISMIGVKMVPILEKDDGTFMPESMDIVAYIDVVGGAPAVAPSPSVPADDPLRSFLEGTRAYLYRLAMPRWAEAPLPEFKTESSRAYFVKKKEPFVGPFAEALAQTPALKAAAEQALAALEPHIGTAQTGARGYLSQDDFHLFAALRSLSVVKDLHVPPRVAAYAEAMAERSGVPLHHALAR